MRARQKQADVIALRRPVASADRGSQCSSVQDDSDEKIVLSKDGQPGHAYGQLAWSPDSKTLVAFRTEPGDLLEVHLVRFFSEGGGRAQLESRPYALPGDKFARHELNVFQIEGRRQLKPQVDRFESEWETPKCRWSADGGHLRYEQVDRATNGFESSM